MEKQKLGLAIICSGTGFEARAIRFLEEQLGWKEGLDYDLIAKPGSVHSLAADGKKFRHHQQSLVDDIVFLVENHKLPRVVVLDHGSCAWFKELSEQDRAFSGQPQTAMLREALDYLRGLLPSGVQVEAWYGYGKEDGEIRFEKVA